MKRLLMLTGLLALVGCGNDAMEIVRSENGARADMIAVIKGCEVYRLNDGRHVYVTICPNGSANAQHQVSCGKGCTRPLINQTVMKGE